MIRAFLDIFRPERTVGVRCNLCGWSWRDPNMQDAFDSFNKAKADRLFELHIKDKHPHLLRKEGE